MSGPDGIAWQPRPLLWGILLLYTTITVGYGIINPLFEAPDEHHHFFTVLYIAENGRLPVADYQDEWIRQEAAQPPLYYLLGALLIRGIDTTQAQTQVWENPFANLGDASALTNINRFITISTQPLPGQGSRLAGHLLRLFSTLLGLGTLLCIYAGGCLLWPQQPQNALLATGLIAFLPQFNFIHSAISNDTLAIFFCTAALWQLLRLWQTYLSWPRLLWLGVTVGLAILSKTVGLLLLIYVCGLVFLLGLRDWHGQQHHDPAALIKPLFRSLSLVLLPALALASWLWWRNWQLYGDITATTPFIEFAGGDRQYTLLQVLGEWPSLWSSLFAMFGWFNLSAPQWVYWLWYFILLVAVMGVVKTAVSRFNQNGRQALVIRRPLPANLQQPWFIALWLALWILAVYAGLVTFMLRTEAAQGRLLFPALLPLALALAYGLSRWRSVSGFILPLLAALVTTLFCLFFVIRPAYAVPLTVTSLPAQAAPVETEMGRGVKLVGTQIETTTAVPGEAIWLTLYWQADAPPSEPPELVVEILGQGLIPVGRLHSYHGRGLYPANLWPAGQIVADRFAVRLETEIQTPVWAAVNVGLAGEPQRATIGHVDLRPQAWPAPAAPALAIIGEGILLTAVSISQETAQPGDLLTVSAQWQVTTSRLQADYTTLVHLGQPDQVPLVTGDSSPLAGHYPTHLWSDGAVINDVYLLSLPPDIAPGRYPLWIGMYDSHTLTRLPLMIDNQRQSNDIYLAGWIEVVSH